MHDGPAALSGEAHLAREHPVFSSNAPGLRVAPDSGVCSFLGVYGPRERTLCRCRYHFVHPWVAPAHNFCCRGETSAVRSTTRARGGVQVGHPRAQVKARAEPRGGSAQAVTMGMIHAAMVVVFIVALAGFVGWIVPILVIAGLEFSGFFVSERRNHRPRRDA